MKEKDYMILEHLWSFEDARWALPSRGNNMTHFGIGKVDGDYERIRATIRTLPTKRKRSTY